jgi:very-short-patch-repair endonuclease
MSKHKYSANKIKFKQYRKDLRNNSTSAEATLWEIIKNKQLDGKKFRRQHGIENYIVDFYCSSEKLIIELDGQTHGDYAQIEKDEIRDKFFNDNGYTVLRFENRFIFQDPEFVIDEIRKKFTGPTTSPLTVSRWLSNS